MNADGHDLVIRPKKGAVASWRSSSRRAASGIKTARDVFMVCSI
jgi:hypothetical protein